ncbi:hypothetical protein [Dipodfec virus UOA04_Rod_819]|nr:hypothetical protein [Dipodfec virus UOA04_Rod_819]
MKRFINNPSRAQSYFNHEAFKVHPLNLVGTYQRGGMRLS